MTLGQYLKEKRELSGLSQTELAEKLGWDSGQFVSNIERDECNPTLTKVKKYSRLVGADLTMVAEMMTAKYEAKLWRKLNR
jgi:transcriptional regulator with XRE-family HTH domain